MSLVHADYARNYRLRDRTRPWVLPFIQNNSRVLDVGCYTGATSDLLKRLKACQVVGIDVCAEALNIAADRLDEVFLCDLENLQSLREMPNGRFDAILALSVLEHVRYPERVIEELVQRLRPKGTLIAALPNIAFWQSRLRILLGRFDYAKAGILDKGHLRFFNLHSARKMLQRAGLAIESEQYFVRLPFERRIRKSFWRLQNSYRRCMGLLTGKPIELAPKRHRDAMRENGMAGLGRIWPNLLAWKLVFVCRRPAE